MTAVVDEGTGYAGPPRKGKAALFVIVPVALVMVLIIAVLFKSDPAGTQQGDTFLAGRPAPLIDGTTLDGGHFNLDQQRGRWVVVNFFATWCVPCKQEHPNLVTFYRTHLGETGGPALVSVGFQDSPDNVSAFFRQEGGGFPVIAADSSAQGNIALDYGITGVPETFLVDPLGIVRARLVGGIRSSSDLDNAIANLEAQLAAQQSEAP
jgi:cytochrome c biogenesis protein CcmG, thiol:disulfide interchange protein DsbE